MTPPSPVEIGAKPVEVIRDLTYVAGAPAVQNGWTKQALDLYRPVGTGNRIASQGALQIELLLLFGVLFCCPPAPPPAITSCTRVPFSVHPHPCQPIDPPPIGPPR